jgi:hypothetical protein
MGIVRMVDYTRGTHNVYKERYTDPAQWQKEFDADIRFWLKFNADWYESVILSKDHMTFHWLLQGKPLSVSYERFA